MSFTPNEARYQLWTQDLDLLNDTLKVMLATSAWTPDQDDAFVAAITGGTSKELSGAGYVAGFNAAGRQTLTTQAVSKDDSTDTVTFTADDVTWTTINAGTARYAVIVKEITDDSDSIIVAVLDLNPTVGIVTDGNDFFLRFSNGIILSKAA